MTDYSEIKELIVMRVYDFASQPGAPDNLSGAQIINFVMDITGGAMAKAAFLELVEEGCFRQTAAIMDDEQGRYEVYPALFRLAEEIRNAELPDNRKGSFRNFCEKLLVALAKEEEKGGPKYYDLKSVADNAGLEYSEGWVRKGANNFDEVGYINTAFTLGGGADGNLNSKLTGGGLEAAQDLMEVEDIPAADRLVRRSDNEEVWSNAVDGSKFLCDALEAKNDTGDLSSAEYEQKLSEVRALQILLEAPQVQWDALDRLAENTVKYLAIKFVDNAVGIAAHSLINVLTILLTQGI